ncbi:MAG: class I SAM-dependent methyltransferase [Candidatus Eisenbacteria bacterium]|uniref:Class I SAM-dependent methyltransferase n=1 Tax=Eiseniibacteriota bacterium TaxID=2212470 RepID=A0A948W5L9_UNCEI|nr:class I SAM-dependent methyltransferase [Candidatus Eisenbacteria bacterium]MBU1951164.1 class I SAM-dependent methyltransferase [Candidatus Eisenbacteria bacterium]MBU2690145.1 class I SAM-dependent methyltransferase [Candidatus Eisenbacteria bacterium]
MVFNTLLNQGAVASTSKVLEVGCGTGNHISALRSATQCTCWGFGPSKEMLGKARKKLESIHFALSRAGNLCAKRDFLDLIYSVDVIHHLNDIPPISRTPPMSMWPVSPDLPASDVYARCRLRRPVPAAG